MTTHLIHVDAMTNSISIGLLSVILGAIFVDYAFFGTEHFMFLAKKWLDLLEWLAFWR